MCAALSLCVHAPKSPLIPFICTAGIRIEDRSSKRGFELSSFYQPMLCPPPPDISMLEPIDHSVPSSTFLKISLFQTLLIPRFIEPFNIGRELCSTFQKKEKSRDDRLKEKSELNFTFFSKIFLKKMQKRKKSRNKIAFGNVNAKPSRLTRSSFR